MKKRFLVDFGVIIFGSMIYAIGTVLFIFPHSLLLGGTSGISVILNNFITWSPGTILLIINFTLLVVAFLTLGKEMAIKTVIGSALTTVFVRLVEGVAQLSSPLIQNIYISAIVGALIIAISSGILFYVGSNSGGTDIIALIIKKYFKINIGKALLITDVLIVVFGGVISGVAVAIASFAGLIIKTCGIDFVIDFIKKRKNTKEVK